MASLTTEPFTANRLKKCGIITVQDLGKRAGFPTTECLAGSCIVWRVSVGWKGETELAKERLPFWGKIWYNRMAEGKNAARRLGLRLSVYWSPAAGSL